MPVVLIPWRDTGDAARLDALEFVRDCWTAYCTLHSAQWRLGMLPATQPWSKGWALRRIAQDPVARAANVLIVADADVIPQHVALHTAVTAVRQGDVPWAVPYTQVLRLTDRWTRRLLDTRGDLPGKPRTERPPYSGTVGGGIVVLPRAAWDAVDGIDPRFVGWGGEDDAFAWALETLVGPPRRVTGNLLHLWHPHQVGGARAACENADSQALRNRYRRAFRDPAAMGALVEEHAGLTPPV